MNARSLLAALPATLGLLVMTAVAYLGHRGHESAGWIILGGVAAGAASLILAPRGVRPAPREEPPRREEPGWRAREHTALLRDTADEVARRIDEVRMPLHVLLTAPFGELNENQEEMIGAARAATDALAERIRVVSRLLDLEGGSDPAPIHPRDLLAPVLAAASAILDVDIPPALPTVRIDAAIAREALALILGGLTHEPGARTRLSAHAAGSHVVLRIETSSPASEANLSLPSRLLRLQGAELTSPSAGTLELQMACA